MGKLQDLLNTTNLTKRQKAVILPVLIAVGASAVIIAIIFIVIIPRVNNSQRGVAANGFTAYAETDTTLGVDNVVTLDEVRTILGDKAKSIKPVSKSVVFNYNGDRSQTATFDFTRADGKQASVYIDLTVFQNATSMKNAKVTASTLDAGKINGNSAYFMHAQTLGSVREYRLLVVKGLNAYKFVIDQPSGSLTITEVASLAALKRLATKADL